MLVDDAAKVHEQALPEVAPISRSDWGGVYLHPANLAAWTCMTAGKFGPKTVYYRATHPVHLWYLLLTHLYTCITHTRRQEHAYSWTVRLAYAAMTTLM